MVQFRQHNSAETAAGTTEAGEPKISAPSGLLAAPGAYVKAEIRGINGADLAWTYQFMPTLFAMEEVGGSSDSSGRPNSAGKRRWKCIVAFGSSFCSASSPVQGKDRITFLVGVKHIDAPAGSFLRVPAGVTHDFENNTGLMRRDAAVKPQ